MTLEAPAARDEPLGPEPGARPSERIEERAASVALSLLPGALIVYFSFEGGGYFAGSVAFIALLLTQILLVRVLFAQHPFAGIGRRHAIVVAIFAAYAAWTLASALWSHALGRALVEFDRSLLYLLLLLLFGCAQGREWRVPLILRGVAGGCLVVCTVSLITRVLPHVWPIAADVADNRLNYPLTYWNALGILATIGTLTLLGISANPRESIAARALATAGVPVTVTVLYFTFSRGAIGALLIGLVVFVLLARSAAAAGALVSTLPAVAVALVTSYHATLLATLTPTTNGAVQQGHRVAVVVGAAAAAAAGLRIIVNAMERAARRHLGTVAVTTRVRRATTLGALVALLSVLVWTGAPSFVAREFRQSFRASTATSADLRSRLTDPSNTVRVEHWRVALKTFRSAPLIGTGADTFERAWYQDRKPTFRSTPVVDAHSLYLQTLSDLGIVGLLLLLGTLVPILVFVGRRVRGSNRVVYAALFSALAAWMIHAGIDWDWEMPAVTAWVFAVGGAVLASRASPALDIASGRGSVRVSIALMIVLSAATPLLLMLSQDHLSAAADAFGRGRCAHVEADAVASVEILAVRPQPYQMLGYCDISDGRFADAVSAMREAVSSEPGNWEYHYGLAIADAYAGVDPRPALAAAERLNPGDPLEQQMVPVYGTHSLARWLATARTAYAGTFASGRLTLR